MNTDIVKATEILPSQEEVVKQLDDLEASGDTQALSEVARRAKAYQEYEARENATERANYFGRIKIQAEARIGSIDLELHPKPGKSVLQFDDVAVLPSRRGQWRMLGAGLHTGQLDKAMALVEDRSDTVYTCGVVRELRHMGALMVWTAPLLKRYQELYRRDKLTISEVQRRAGLDSTTSHFLTRPGTLPKQDKVARPVALQVAAVLGVDVKELKNAPQHRKYRRRSTRRSKKLTGGRLDQTYVLIRKSLQELDRVTGQSGLWGTAEAWEHLYAAEEIIGKALRRAPTS